MQFDVWPPLEELKRERKPKSPLVWYGPGTTLTFEGVTVKAPLVYVSAQDESRLERSALALGVVDWFEEFELDSDDRYWAPFVAAISPEARTRYLRWLTGGRSGSDIDEDLLLLFIGGLERRAIARWSEAQASREERDLIEQTLRDLRQRYGPASPDVRRAATHVLAFVTVGLSLLECVASRMDSLPEWGAYQGWNDAAIAIGWCAAHGQPVPVDWAFVWATAKGYRRPSVVARRCFREYEQLFEILFAEAFPKGFIVRPHVRATRVGYRPINYMISPRTFYMPETADVTHYNVPLKALARVAASAATVLQGFNRWRTAHPDVAADTFAYLAALPGILQEARRVELEQVLAPLRGQMESGPTRMTARTFLDLTLGAQTSLDVFKAKTMVGVTDALALVGIGLEVHPDASVRMANGHVVLVPIKPAGGEQRGPELARARMFGSLLWAAAKMEGLGTGQIRMAKAGLVRAFGLNEVEAARIAGYFEVLAGTTVKPGPIKTYFAPEDTETLDAAVALLLAVALADGVPGPAETAMVERGLGLLGREPGSAAVTLHEAMADAGTTRTPMAAGQRDGPMQLDRARIRTTTRQSQSASAQIAALFEDDAETLHVPLPGTDSVVEGLDGAHLALLRALAMQSVWTADDFRSLCADMAVLPNGAIDSLNDVAFERFDEPLISGGGPYEINTEVLRAMETGEPSGSTMES